VLITVSFFIFVLSLTVDMKISNNLTIAYLSSGVFFISLANFASLTVKQSIYRSFDIKGIIEQEIHKLTFPSVIMYFAGGYLLVKGFFIF